jgi:hypothetical protein
MGVGCVGISTIVSVGNAVDVGVNEGSIVADGTMEAKDAEVGVAESDTAGASVVTVIWRLPSIGKLQPASKMNRGKLNFKACL